jgi:hypothetical protein
MTYMAQIAWDNLGVQTVVCGIKYESAFGSYESPEKGSEVGCVKGLHKVRQARW